LAKHAVDGSYRGQSVAAERSKGGVEAVPLRAAVKENWRDPAANPRERPVRVRFGWPGPERPAAPQKRSCAGPTRRPNWSRTAALPGDLPAATSIRVPTSASSAHVIAVTDPTGHISIRN